MPLVIVTEALPEPLPLHDPVVVISTALPDAPPVAATLKLVPKVADAGAAVVTVIACAAFCAVVRLVTSGAAL